jgi:hypothetical protein
MNATVNAFPIEELKDVEPSLDYLFAVPSHPNAAAITFHRIFQQCRIYGSSNFKGDRHCFPSQKYAYLPLSYQYLNAECSNS